MDREGLKGRRKHGPLHSKQPRHGTSVLLMSHQHWFNVMCFLESDTCSNRYSHSTNWKLNTQTDLTLSQYATVLFWRRSLESIPLDASSLPLRMSCEARDTQRQMFTLDGRTIRVDVGEQTALQVSISTGDSHKLTWAILQSRANSSNWLLSKRALTCTVELLTARWRKCISPTEMIAGL